MEVLYESVGDDKVSRDLARSVASSHSLFGGIFGRKRHRTSACWGEKDVEDYGLD
jgi:hypothetical protein